jgi:hypothetical protein
MSTANTLLLLGGILSFLAAVLHVGIILGGPSWYRLFGAGERMARLAESGSSQPTLITGSIVLLLCACFVYALSGAGVISRLPFTQPALLLIAAIFLLRGAAGIPFVLWSNGAYAKELKGRMTFMMASSGISLGIGLCYAAGYAEQLH